VVRLAVPGIAALALLCSVAGLTGAGSLLLLAAIVAGAVRLVEVVGHVAEGRGDRLVVALAATGVVCLVAAGATHVVWLVAGLFACAAVELLGEREARAELPAAPVELRRAA
jgi:hypothetical protein